MNFSIRPFHPSDLPDLYRICLLTGASGKDASALYQDPDLLAHFYMAPYVFIEPELAFILCLDGKPMGYVLGTKDSEKFEEWSEKHWFPTLRNKYPMPEESDESFDARIIRRIHTGYKADPDLKEYPAHLHIDLLPEAQGKGQGRKLMEAFIEKLKELKAPALHLGVDLHNPEAIAFYKKVGFHVINEFPDYIAFGMRLV